MPTFNIPKATLRAPGRTASNQIGPFSVPAGAHSFVLSVPLSQAIGAGNSFFVGIWRQIEIGGAWEQFSGFGVDGGYADAALLGCEADFWAGVAQPDTSFPAMRVQMTVDIVGANLALTSQGTLVVS